MWIVKVGERVWGPFNTPLAADKWAQKNLTPSSVYVLQKLIAP